MEQPDHHELDRRIGERSVVVGDKHRTATLPVLYRDTQHEVGMRRSQVVITVDLHDLPLVRGQLTAIRISAGHDRHPRLHLTRLEADTPGEDGERTIRADGPQQCHIAAHVADDLDQRNIVGFVGIS